MAWSDAARAAAAEARRRHLTGVGRRDYFNKARGGDVRGPRDAFYVRNKSASHQFTVWARSSKEARNAGQLILGERNKSRLRAILARNVVGYGKIK